MQDSQVLEAEIKKFTGMKYDALKDCISLSDSPFLTNLVLHNKAYTIETTVEWAGKEQNDIRITSFLDESELPVGGSSLSQVNY